MKPGWVTDDITATTVINTITTIIIGNITLLVVNIVRGKILTKILMPSALAKRKARKNKISQPTKSGLRQTVFYQLWKVDLFFQ